MREIVSLFILFVFIFYHFKSIKKDKLRIYYFPALALKLIAGICVGLVYAFYYKGGDTWSYFNQAKLMSEVAFSSTTHFWEIFGKNNYHFIHGFIYVNQPRATLMVKLVVLVNLITNSNYWLTSFFFSFASFFGVFKFSTWVNQKFRFGKAAALSLFIWPSFVFWSSGILKESVSVGLIFWILATLLRKNNIHYLYKIIFLTLGMAFLFIIKYYYAMVLMVVVLIYVLGKFFNLNKKSLATNGLIWASLLFIGFLVGGFFHPNLKWNNIIGVIMENNKVFLARSGLASSISFLSHKTAWVWVLINIPKALFASLFMPLLINKKEILYLVVVIENWVLLFLFIRGIFFINWSNLKAHINLKMASIAYTIILAVFLALSTPNLGTLNRYKVAFIPIVLVWVVLANRLIIFKKNAR